MKKPVFAPEENRKNVSDQVLKAHRGRFLVFQFNSTENRSLCFIQIIL